MLPEKLQVLVPETKFSARMANFMHSRGFRIKDSAKKHIKWKLESEFGDILHIYKDEAGKLIAVPDSMWS